MDWEMAVLGIDPHHFPKSSYSLTEVKKKIKNNLLL